MSLAKISLCTELQTTMAFWGWLLLFSLFSLCSCAKAESAFLHPWPLWAFMFSESLKKQVFERATQPTRAFEKCRKLKWVEFRINMLLFQQSLKTDFVQQIYLLLNFTWNDCTLRSARIAFVGSFSPKFPISPPEYMCLVQNLLNDILWLMWDVRFDYFNNNF